MSWIKALPVDSLPEGERQVVKLGQRSILLLNHNSQLIAVDNKCPHLKLSLKKGKITEDEKSPMVEQLLTTIKQQAIFIQ